MPLTFERFLGLVLMLLHIINVVVFTTLAFTLHRLVLDGQLRVTIFWGDAP